MSMNLFAPLTWWWHQSDLYSKCQTPISKSINFPKFHPEAQKLHLTNKAHSIVPSPVLSCGAVKIAQYCENNKALHWYSVRRPLSDPWFRVDDFYCLGGQVGPTAWSLLLVYEWYMDVLDLINAGFPQVMKFQQCYWILRSRSLTVSEIYSVERFFFSPFFFRIFPYKVLPVCEYLKDISSL